MTFVRSRRSLVVHATADARSTLCSRKCDGYIVEPDTAVTCSQCIRVVQEIEANGN